jgi:hypothetical protein
LIETHQAEIAKRDEYEAARLDKINYQGKKSTGWVERCAQFVHNAYWRRDWDNHVHAVEILNDPTAVTLWNVPKIRKSSHVPSGLNSAVWPSACQPNGYSCSIRLSLQCGPRHISPMALAPAHLGCWQFYLVCEIPPPSWVNSFSIVCPKRQLWLERTWDSSYKPTA